MEQKELTTTLSKDRPGELSKAITAIANMNVNIEGFCESDGNLHLVTSDPKNARKALETVGFTVEERDLFIVEAEDRPGFLANLLRRVAAEEVNLIAAYTLTNTRIGFTVDRPARVREFINELTPAAARTR